MKRPIALVSFAVLLILAFVFLGCRNPFCPKDEEPYVVIDRPPPVSFTIMLPPIIAFEWHSGLDRDPRSVRYMWFLIIEGDELHDPGPDIVKDLNDNPERYEDKWSNWIRYNAPDEQGRKMVLGDDETLENEKYYIFAVQAKDRCGRVTTVFETGKNVCLFRVNEDLKPILLVTEPFLGSYKFIGTECPIVPIQIPPGIPLNFSWHGEAKSYGGEIVGYRYGWDILDVNDPNEWEVPWGPDYLSAPEKTFHSGIHTFIVETKEYTGTVTRGVFEISIVPFTMERNLLWVDDFYSTDFTQVLWAMPTETQHDEFWIDICNRAIGFDESRDVYDCAAYNLVCPEIAEIGKYKNIIWTYSCDFTCWKDVIKFTRENGIGTCSGSGTNYLPLFLQSGGHLWTLGRSDMGGGLAAMFNEMERVFPVIIRCDVIGHPLDCIVDKSGPNTMAYRDYCVTMIDKIVGKFRMDDDMPYRHVRNRDAMVFAMLDDTDPVTAQYPALPERLDLWEEITKPGRYFDPNAPAPWPGGFTYIEIYDPVYWMDRNFIMSQDCFHPIYRMRARNVLSPVDQTVIAIWITKYEDNVPIAGTGPAARSFHLGFPLWFFNREQVDAIVDVVFDEWQINKH